MECWSIDSTEFLAIVVLADRRLVAFGRHDIAHGTSFYAGSQRRWNIHIFRSIEKHVKYIPMLEHRFYAVKGGSERLRLIPPFSHPIIDSKMIEPRMESGLLKITGAYVVHKCLPLLSPNHAQDRAAEACAHHPRAQGAG